MESAKSRLPIVSALSVLQPEPGRLDTHKKAETMKRIAVSKRVLNSLLYIRDPAINELPEIWDLLRIWATPSCVAVSCLPDSEGETEIVIGDSEDVALGAPPLFQGQIRTPSRTFIVETVDEEILLQVIVPSVETAIRIWTNGHPATDRVVIGLDRQPTTQ